MKQQKQTPADAARDAEMIRETEAVELLQAQGNNEEAEMWLNTYSDQGEFFESEQIDAIFAQFAKKDVKVSNWQAHDFNEEQVAEIRTMRAAGTSLKVIAAKFGCSIPLISKISRNKIYRKGE